MTRVKHLEKIAEIVKDVRTCMMATIANNGEMRARPMATASYDDQGNIWFFTDEDSQKINELANKQPILLAYSKPEDNCYLSLTVKAEVVDDMAKKVELFNTFTKAWYPEGPESEELTLLKMTPQTAEYWDSSDSKVVQLFRIGKAILTGKKYEADDDEHGSININ